MANIKHPDLKGPWSYAKQRYRESVEQLESFQLWRRFLSAYLVQKVFTRENEHYFFFQFLLRSVLT